MVSSYRVSVPKVFDYVHHSHCSSCIIYLLTLELVGYEKSSKERVIRFRKALRHVECGPSQGCSREERCAAEGIVHPSHLQI